MVMASPKRSVASGAKWSLYIFLATSVNLALASLVSIDMQPKSKSTQPPLQLSLLSTPTPSQQQESATTEPVETAATQPAQKTRTVVRNIEAIPQQLVPAKSVVVEEAEKTALVQPMTARGEEAEKREIVRAEPTVVSRTTSDAQAAQSKTPEIARADAVENTRPAHRPRSARRDQFASAQATAVSNSIPAPKLVYNAQYRYQVPPQYPRRALELGQEGLVMMHVEVMQNGKPGEMKIVHSSGYRLLDIAALSAVKKWEFEPMSTSDAAMASWVRVPVNFTIEK